MRSLILLLVLQSLLCHSQIDKYYGGCGNEMAVSFIADSSEFNILGMSDSFDYNEFGDIYNILLDSVGNSKWAKTYRIDIHNEWPKEILKWNNNLTLIIGSTIGYNHYYIIAVDSLGQILWDKRFFRYRVDNMIRSKSNEIVLCGYYATSGSEGMPPAVITLDSLGNISSAMYYKFTPYDSIVNQNFKSNSILQDDNGNYILAGLAYTPTKAIFVMKLDENLNLLWSRVWKNQIWRVTKHVQDFNDGFLIAGIILPSTKTFILRIDSFGNIIWNKKISISDSPTTSLMVNDFIMTNEGDILFSTSRAEVIKLDQNCNVIWANQYDTNSAYSVEYPTSILEWNNHYYLLKTSDSNPVSDSLSPEGYKRDILIVKIDSTGYSDVNHTAVNLTTSAINLEPMNFSFYRQDSIIPFYDIQFYESTVSSSFSTYEDCLTVETTDSHYPNPEINFYPNPTSGVFTIEADIFINNKVIIEVYDLMGTLVHKIETKNKKHIKVDLPNDKKGLFIIKVSSKKYAKSFKINCL